MAQLAYLAALSQIADGQHGVVSRAQAVAAGLKKDSISRLVSSRAWSRLHPGIYSLWAPNDPSGLRRHHLIAATLWLGGGSAASHRAAAWLRGLDGLSDPPIELSSTRRHRNPPDVILHYARRLPDADIEVVQGIRVTSVARTLIDLGAVVPASVVERAFESALRRKLTDEKELAARLGNGSRRSGAATLRSLLETRPAAATESDLETLLWQLLRDADLPLPVRQYKIRTPDGDFVARADFAYPDRRVIIEADGYGPNSSQRDWNRDRERQAVITELGWIVLRVTRDDVTKRPRVVARRVRRLLDSRES